MNFFEKATITDQSGETTYRIGSSTEFEEEQFVAILLVVVQVAQIFAWLAAAKTLGSVEIKAQLLTLQLSLDSIQQVIGSPR